MDENLSFFGERDVEKESMTTIVGIAGSLRAGSLNAALLRTAATMMPSGTTLGLGSIAGIPLYDGDLEEREGIPLPVQMLKDQIASSEGLLLVTPEYNHSLPGVFKNAVDWLSRPPGDAPRVFRGRAVGVIGCTPGGMGTAYAQSAWLPVLRALGTRPWFGKALNVPRAGQVFDADGRMIDETIAQRLEDYLEGFSTFAAAG